jgi:hypothetical protein
VIGSALRKLGGAAAHPAEAATLLRAGNLVCVGGHRSFIPRPWSAIVSPGLLAAAADVGAPIVPVSVRLGAVPLTCRVAIG